MKRWAERSRSKGCVGRIERAEQNVTVETLCRVAEALETTVHELLLGAPARR